MVKIEATQLYGMRLMRLFDRDYTFLWPTEEKLWQEVQQREIVGAVGDLSIRRSLFYEYPKAARHFIHIFPNNYLDIVELTERGRLLAIVDSFEAAIDSDSASERSILNFIAENRAWFLIGSLLKERFQFGHHEAYLFPEFQLGNSYKVDYLLVGKSSSGYHFVFVELEAPTGSITLSSGDLGSAFRKGVTQVSNWDSWLDARYPALGESFEKLKRRDMLLPLEFSQLDRSRLHFIVVAGRRKDFNDKTYQLSRKSPYQLLHYDNIVDDARELIGKPSY